MTNKYYKNKNILVIGGSFGIGEQLCKQLSDLGANIAIVARSEKKIHTIQQSLSGANIAIPCDVLKLQDLKKLSEELHKKWQQIDLVIFCVGTYQPMNIQNFNLEKSKEIIDINVNSLLNTIDAFLDDFKQKRITHLAIISSVAGYFGMPNSLAYGCSKSALSHLSESLRYELKKYGTKVQLINPGFVNTRLTALNDFKMPQLLSPHTAAALIIKQLPKNKFEIAFPFMFVFVLKILSLMPYTLRFLLLKRLSM